MPRPNPYPISGIKDPHLQRVLQDMVDRQSFLEREIERLGGAIPVGMAKRESPVQGLISIPYRDPGGRDGSIQVSPDGVIQSYTNPIESEYPYIDVRTVGNITTGLDPLHVPLTVKAGTLGVDGAYFHMRYAGSFANTEADKQIQILFGGQTVTAHGGVIDIETGGWLYDINLVRTSPITTLASVLCTMINLRKADGALVATPSGGFVFAQTTTQTVTNLNTTSLDLEVKGEGTNTDDVVQNLSIVELYLPRMVKKP